MSLNLPKASLYPFILCSALALTACGGSGGGSDPAPVPDEVVTPPTPNEDEGQDENSGDEQTAAEVVIDLTGVWDVSISDVEKQKLQGIDPIPSLAPGGRMIVNDDTENMVSISQCLPPGSQISFPRDSSSPNAFSSDTAIPVELVGTTFQVTPNAKVNNKNSVTLNLNIKGEYLGLPVVIDVKVDLKRSPLDNEMIVRAETFPNSPDVVCAVVKETNQPNGSGTFDLILTTIFDDQFMFLAFQGIVDQEDDESVNGNISNRISVISTPLKETYDSLGIVSGGIDVIDSEDNYFGAEFNFSIPNGPDTYYQVTGEVEIDGFNSMKL